MDKQVIVKFAKLLKQDTCARCGRVLTIRDTVVVHPGHGMLHAKGCVKS